MPKKKINKRKSPRRLVKEYPGESDPSHIARVASREVRLQNEARQKHTPGPWETTYSDDMDDCRFIVNNVDVPILIADVYPDTALAYQVPSPDEWRANAHLIAASPDLLDALRLVLRDRDAGCLRKDTCEHIEAVIAKAEGGKQ